LIIISLGKISIIYIYIFVLMFGNKKIIKKERDCFDNIQLLPLGVFEEKIKIRGQNIRKLPLWYATLLKTT